MKEIKPSFSIETEVDGRGILKRIERAARTAYKSESSISADSSKEFVARLISMGHLSVIEHESITVRIVCDRGVTHEIVRHRIASYTQESTRYCNYADGKFGSEITVITPCFWDEKKATDNEKLSIWRLAMKAAEEAYQKLIKSGASPQEARSVLPNSLKTEIVVTMNLREWRHFFSLRTSPSAHPQMREIAIPLLMEFKEKIPVIFDDLE
jgi:thymidylate synthase (FAD)